MLVLVLVAMLVLVLVAMLVLILKNVKVDAFGLAASMSLLDPADNLIVVYILDD